MEDKDKGCCDKCICKHHKTDYEPTHCINPSCPCHSQTREESWEEINISITELLLGTQSMLAEIGEFGSRSPQFDERQKQVGDAIDKLKKSITNLLIAEREKGEQKTGKAYMDGFDDGQVSGIGIGKKQALQQVREIVHDPLNTKPYSTSDNTLATENKAGWNTCLEFVKERINEIDKLEKEV